MMKFFMGTLILCLFSLSGFAQVIADFSIPDTVCVNAPVPITNTSTGASTYFWNFCTANLSSSPTVTNMGNPGGFNWPVFIDYVFDNGNYYGFMSNYRGGNLIRLDFGNSLLNTPTSTDLGNFGGIIPASIGSEGIQIVNQGGNWFVIIVGGNMVLSDQPRILKIEFGSNITNPAPTAVNWGNVGNMDQPVDLHLYEDAGRWFGFTINAENNSITRFDFTTSFSNTPIGTNLGNIGGLSYPTGIFVTNDNGFWRVFVVNAGDNSRTNSTPSSLTRLDFGNSLQNTPVGINLGNPGGLLQHPRDITLMKSCDQIIAFAVNGNLNNADIVRLDFNNDLTSVPVGSIAGNLGNGSFPHCISKLFRDRADVYGFVANVVTGSLMRLRFSGCSNSNQGSSNQKDPPPVTYNAPGIYNINLTVDDGLPTQTMICKRIVVQDAFPSDFNYEQDVCNPLSVRFFNTNPAIPTPQWSFGDGSFDISTLTPAHTYSAYGNYEVKFTVLKNRCADTVKKIITLRIGKEDIVLTPDTIVCVGATKQLRSKAGLGHCWTPALYLDNPSAANPVTSTPVDMTYFCTSQIRGPNLVVNGDFSAGNTGFSSDYKYKPPPSSAEGEYYVSPNPNAWHSGMNTCPDHTGNNGNMMMVNGSVISGAKIWSQTITVTPNTNYEFSTWTQTLNNLAPTTLQFSINNQEVGNPVISGAPCSWMQFYTTWNSGNRTTATITIVNKSTVLVGNDFALDDISFSNVEVQYDSVKIAIETPDVDTRTDTTICNNTPVRLPATGGTSWSWIPANTLSDPTVADPVATPAATTEYIVAGTTVNGCTAKDTVLITVIPKLTLDITADTSVCSNAPVQLRAFASGNPSIQWYPAMSLDNPGLPNPVASPLFPTKYYVELRDSYNCLTRDSVQVDFIAKPKFDAKGPAAVCYDTETGMEATGGDTYQWSPATYLDDPQSATPIIKAKGAVTYSVHIAENFCGYDTLIQFAPLRVNPLPVVRAIKESDINCVVRSVKLMGSGALSYSWFPALALDNPHKRDPIAAVDTSTQFIVTGKNQFGCTDNDTLQVFVTKTGTPVFEMPNAFTPNNDGKNDCFGVKKWGSVKLQQFEVFNRWGEKIWSTTNPGQCWDGTYKGKQQDSGEFIYVIKASTFCGSFVRKGVFFLIR